MTVMVLGYDGSECADASVGLVGSTPWAPGSTARLVTVIPDLRAIRSAWGALVVGSPEQIDRELSAEATRALEAPVARLRQQGLAASGVVVHGRPAQGIARAASDARANLVVVGSRGLGGIESTLLGSVSQEVVDAAPCPVLVARRGAVTHVLFGTDGSPEAELAERFLAALPVVRRVSVRVVSVAEVIRPWAIGITPTLYREAMASQAQIEAESRQVHAELARAAAARLAAGGAEATSEVRVGDPAGELLAAASDAAADLIVLGSRGRTGLSRLVLGSVARRVVQHARASVLIVRPSGAPSTRDEIGGPETRP